MLFDLTGSDPLNRSIIPHTTSVRRWPWKIDQAVIIGGTRQNPASGCTHWVLQLLALALILYAAVLRKQPALHPGSQLLQGLSHLVSPPIDTYSTPTASHHGLAQFDSGVDGHFVYGIRAAVQLVPTLDNRWPEVSRMGESEPPKMRCSSQY